MKRSKYVIVGGGMVAGYAAKELVERGLKPGELTILSAESSLPYERPPLSKGFLSGKDTEEGIRISPADFYGQHGIDVRLRCQVEGLDCASKVLRLHSGEELGYEQLVLAAGARPKTLDIPGSKMAGILYLRSMEDSKRIRLQAESAKRAVVIGGGFIGMEVAAVLAQKGIAVTMVLHDDRIWKQFFTPAMSSFFEGYYSSRGVSFARRANVAELRGNGSVESVVLQSGDNLPCDFVVAGIGVRPVTEVFANSGIDVSDGVVVDERLQSNQPGIYAAGDVASYQDALFNKRRRVEHWDNAVSQGQHCARALLGDHAPFVHVLYFFSDVFDLSYEFWGDPSGADKIVERGDMTSSSFSVWWLIQERVVAAFTMNRPEEERDAAPRWIQSKQHVSAEQLKGAGPVTAAERS
jgi:NADPH-dependent 2,4-dienoyl-CoA reductase/sulfur reductase-like enzyme